MAANIDWDVYVAIRRIKEILATNILSAAGQHVFKESAFIEVMVRLNELLQKADSAGNRISFVDDVRIFPGVNDITDAVRECRDAVCHARANGHYITPEGHPKPRGAPTNQCFRLTFCTANGRGIFLQTPRYTIQSEHDDDVCFFYGAHRIYLKRHIVRALGEVKAVLMPHDPFAPHRRPEQ